MNELDEFGKIFINEVRDRSIEDVDMSISGTYRSKRAIELTQQFSSLDKNSKEFIEYFEKFKNQDKNAEKWRHFELTT